MKKPGIYQTKKNLKMELNFTDFLENELTEDMKTGYKKEELNIGADFSIPSQRMTSAHKYNNEDRLTIHRRMKVGNTGGDDD